MIGQSQFRGRGLQAVNRTCPLIYDSSLIKSLPCQIWFSNRPTETPSNSQLVKMAEQICSSNMPMKEHLFFRSFIRRRSECLSVEAFSKCQTCWEPWQTSAVTENSQSWHLHLTLSTLFFSSSSLWKDLWGHYLHACNGLQSCTERGILADLNCNVCLLFYVWELKSIESLSWNTILGTDNGL